MAEDDDADLCVIMGTRQREYVGLMAELDRREVVVRAILADVREARDGQH